MTESVEYRETAIKISHVLDASNEYHIISLKDFQGENKRSCGRPTPVLCK